MGLCAWKWEGRSGYDMDLHQGTEGYLSIPYPHLWEGRCQRSSSTASPSCG